MTDQYGSAEVLEDLRQRIASGDLPAGALMPTYEELGARFQVSRATLHKAIDRLKRDGLIRTAGRAGMHVVDKPPCQYRYALLLPTIDQRENRFHASVAEAAGPLASERGIALPIVHGFLPVAGHPILGAVAEEVAARRLAGLVVAGNPAAVLQAMDLGTHRIPVVGFANQPAEGLVSNLVPDHARFVELACAWLAERGRTRVAMIGPPVHPSMTAFGATLARHGLGSDPCWQLSVDLRSAASARAIAHLLMRSVPTPDAVLLPDDNIAGHALAGLADAGVAIGSALDVVAHANFPLPGPSPQGVRNLGFDVPALLAQAIDCIDACRAGAAPVHRLVAPRFLDA